MFRVNHGKYATLEFVRSFFFQFVTNFNPEVGLRGHKNYKYAPHKGRKDSFGTRKTVVFVIF